MKKLFSSHCLHLLWALTTVLVVVPLQARVRLPHILSDGMVMQQQADITFWGWAEPNTSVTVAPSWQTNKQTVTSDSKGRWRVVVRTPKAGFTPLSITFSDGQPLTISSMLAGEVWVCAGQSNMEMPVRGFDECPVEGYQEAVSASANMRGVRYVKIPARMSSVPLEDTPCRWVDVNPKTVNNCSAVGFFFAQRLAQMLQIPVGLVLANKGGTMVESWLDAENLRKHTDEPTDSAALARKYPTEWLRPLLWGNGTFQPIVNYSVRGVLFYQGCSNVDHHSEAYADRLRLLISQWRRDFNSPNLPFYLVEIAPHNYGNALATDAAFIRMQQQRVAQTVNNTVLVGTNDLVYPGEADQIHPCQKRQIGERLAMTAAARDYGFDQILYRCPSFDRMEVRGDSCLVHLKDTYNGIATALSYEGFEVAGDDKVFHPAHARYIRNSTFLLNSPAVVRPVAIRYCYHNFQLGTVKNQAGLPLLPFATD